MGTSGGALVWFFKPFFVDPDPNNNKKTKEQEDYEKLSWAKKLQADLVSWGKWLPCCSAVGVCTYCAGGEVVTSAIDNTGFSRTAKPDGEPQGYLPQTSGGRAILAVLGCFGVWKVWNWCSSRNTDSDAGESSGTTRAASIDNIPETNEQTEKPKGSWTGIIVGVVIVVVGLLSAVGFLIYASLNKVEYDELGDFPEDEERDLENPPPRADEEI